MIHDEHKNCASGAADMVLVDWVTNVNPEQTGVQHHFPRLSEWRQDLGMGVLLSLAFGAQGTYQKRADLAPDNSLGLAQLEQACQWKVRDIAAGGGIQQGGTNSVFPVPVHMNHLTQTFSKI